MNFYLLRLRGSILIREMIDDNYPNAADDDFRRASGVQGERILQLSRCGRKTGVLSKIRAFLFAHTIQFNTWTTSWP